MRIDQFLTRSARQFPQKTALVCGERRITYAEFDAASDRVAATLRAEGIARGDRVVVLAENDVEAVVALFAAAKLGAVLCPLHPSSKADKLRHVLNHCRAAALVLTQRHATVGYEALQGASSVRCCLVSGTTDGATAPLDGAIQFGEAPPDGDTTIGSSPGIELDLAMLLYTSGSTGRPKGVMLTHENVNAAAASVIAYLENTADDVILSALPISHSYGLYQLLTSVRLGATLVLERSFAFPQSIMARMAAERVTGFPIVPTIGAILVQQRDPVPGSFDHLRYLTVAGAPSAPTLLERLRVMVPQARIFAMYGLTECKRATWLPPSELAVRPDSVGVPIPGTEAWIVDEMGNRVPIGVTGELVVRGPHVMKGYWEDEPATMRALRPGPYPWEKVLYTGDLFRADQDGFLYFVARKDDIIKTRGEKVSPKEVETVLYELPGILETAVVGVPDPILGTALKAIVVLDGTAELTAQAVMRHCARRLEDFMVPKLVEFRDAPLPKTETGKISRRHLLPTTESR